MNSLKLKMFEAREEREPLFMDLGDEKVIPPNLNSSGEVRIIFFHEFQHLTRSYTFFEDENAASAFNFVAGRNGNGVTYGILVSFKINFVISVEVRHAEC